MNFPPGTTRAITGADGEAEQAIGRGGGITLRVVLLSLFLAGALGYAIPIIDFKLGNTMLGAQHLPVGAVAVLLALVVVVNPLLRLLWKRGLARNEALTVYITCLFSSLVPGHGSENIIIPSLLAPFYYATRENGWIDKTVPFLKSWMTPALTPSGRLNPAIYNDWYNGNGGHVPWGAWLLPMVFWMGVVLLAYVMLGCLSVMLRAQWAEHEALAFPLLRLPLTMTEDLDRSDTYGILGHFFRDPLMWSGFALAAGIQLVRGLHIYFPDVPDVQLTLDMGPYLSEAPWNQIGSLPLGIYPVAVGVTYLLTSEVSFSLWFFYLFMKMQYVVAYRLGFPPNSLPWAESFPDKLFTGFQMGGCYFAYVGLVLWTARKHLGYIARRAFGRARAKPDERDEPLSYPVAFWGFFGSFALMVALSCAAGVRLDVSIALWIWYPILAIGLSRVAVEGGMLALQHDISPLSVMARLFNTGPSTWITPANGLVPGSFLQDGLMHGVRMRAFVMPAMFHSWKLAKDHKIPMRPLLALISATILISLGVSWWTCIRLGYDNGGLTLGHSWWAQDGPRQPVWGIDSIGNSTTGSAPERWLWMGIGALMTFGMMAGRARFGWFPFHPIGYLMALTYSSNVFWFSIFLGWACKGLISRYGGNDTYRRVTPFFLGLALGDVAIILFWLFVDGWQGRTHHNLLPG